MNFIGSALHKFKFVLPHSDKVWLKFQAH